MPELALGVRLALGLTFLTSVTGKLRDPAGFADGVSDYHILPNRVAYATAYLIIAIELTVAVSHTTGWWMAYTVPTAILMLIVFAMAVSVNIWRGVTLDCYCFGAHNSEPISYRTLGRIGLFMLGEVFLLGVSSQTGESTTMRTPEEFVLGLIVAVVIVVGALWLLSVPDIVDLVRFSSKRRGRSAIRSRTS